MKLKNVAVTVAALVLAVSMTACGSSSSTAASTSEAASAAAQSEAASTSAVAEENSASSEAASEAASSEAASSEVASSTAAFFSSRRRHTRLVSDWSSDVCSSDLRDRRWPGVQGRREGRRLHRGRSEERRVGKECRSRWSPYH